MIGENRTNPSIIDLDLRDYRYCTFISILNDYAGYSNRLPGVLEQFQPLVASFVDGTAEVRRQVLQEARALYDSIDEKKIVSDADYYIKVCNLNIQHFLSSISRFLLFADYGENNGVWSAICERGGWHCVIAGSITNGYIGGVLCTG